MACRMRDLQPNGDGEAHAAELGQALGAAQLQLDAAGAQAQRAPQAGLGAQPVHAARLQPRHRAHLRAGAASGGPTRLPVSSIANNR